MNAIRKAVDDVKFRIPKAILEKTFLKYNAYGRAYVGSTLDDMIINNVIKARVLPDCNIIGGIEGLIPLSGLSPENPTPNSVVVHIPKERTQGRSISSALSLLFLPANTLSSVYNVGGASSCNNPQILSVANQVLNSMDTIPMTSTARVQMIGENTILVRDLASVPSNGYLRCILSNDDELSTIPIRAYRYFSNLVEYAVKAYVYNELIISIDMSQLEGGYNLGVFKDIVSGYSDAEQNYKDYLEEHMQSVLFQSDDASYERFIKLVVGTAR